MVSTLTLDQHIERARASNNTDHWRVVFERVTAQHGAALRRTCRGYERDPNRQEELLQEIWLALWTALPAYEGRSSVRTFVYRVAHNTAVKHIHREARAPRPSEIDIETLAQHLASAEAQLDRRRARQILAESIRALPDLDRQLVLLHLEGLTGRDIAEVTGLSPSNVTTRLSRIRTALARKEPS